MSELLVTCLLCGRSGFTARGIRGHSCAAKAGPKGLKNSSTALTREEKDRAILVAQHGPFAEKSDWSLIDHTAAGVVEDQLPMVREMGVIMLRLVIDWKGTGKTVRKAAEVRLRKLQKQAV